MKKQLEKYQKMRDFEVTSEPSGHTTEKRGNKPIFVVQKHHASQLHYDFRLEMEGVLKSWAVPKGPSYDPTVKRLAMMTEDHPYDYAGFEGVIPAGSYGGGNVIVWDNGTWEFIEPGDDPVEAVRKGKLSFKLQGKKLKGEWALVQIRGKSTKGNEWLLLKHRDGYASETFDVTEEAPLSILSGRDVEDVNPERTWQSNRPGSGSKPRTVATALMQKASAKAADKKKSSSALVAKKQGGGKATATRKPAAKKPTTRSGRIAARTSKAVSRRAETASRKRSQAAKAAKKRLR